MNSSDEHLPLIAIRSDSRLRLTGFVVGKPFEVLGGDMRVETHQFGLKHSEKLFDIRPNQPSSELRENPFGVTRYFERIFNQNRNRNPSGDFFQFAEPVVKFRDSVAVDLGSEVNAED